MKAPKNLKWCIDYSFDFFNEVTLKLYFDRSINGRKYLDKRYIDFLISRVSTIELYGYYKDKEIYDYLNQFNKRIIEK